MKTFAQFVYFKISKLHEIELLQLNNNIYREENMSDNYIYTRYHSYGEDKDIIKKHFKLTTEQELEITKKITSDYYTYNNKTRIATPFYFEKIDITKLTNMITKNKVNNTLYEKYIKSYIKYKEGFEQFVQYKLENMDYITLAYYINLTLDNGRCNNEYIYIDENSSFDSRILYKKNNETNENIYFYGYDLLDYVDIRKLKMLILDNEYNFDCVHLDWSMEYDKIIEKMYSINNYHQPYQNKRN